MNLKDLKNLDKDEILGLLELETKQTTVSWMAGALGTFSLGLLVGAGVALMLAPKPGRELRGDIGGGCGARRMTSARRSRTSSVTSRPQPTRPTDRNEWKNCLVELHLDTSRWSFLACAEKPGHGWGGRRRSGDARARLHPVPRVRALGARAHARAAARSRGAARAQRRSAAENDRLAREAEALRSDPGRHRARRARRARLGAAGRDRRRSRRRGAVAP